MEFTIEQALQQGVAAHKEGKLQEAERLYRAILQSQPSHPDANHNLGELAVSVNKADVALPLFKSALETNPKIEQFWLSYIDALIKEKQFDNAKLVIEQSKTQGVTEEKLNVLRTQIPPTEQVNEPNLAVQNKSLSLSQKRKKLSEQKKQKKVAKQNLNVNNLSQQQLSSLLEFYQNGRFDDAENLAISITQDFPKHQFAWKVLGALLGATGKKSEAVEANQTAVALSPQDAEAHSNLGVTLQELGRLEEALASYNQAIALKPDYAEAYSNLGDTFKILRRLDEAKASYRHAIALNPDFAEAHNNLGITLKELGRLDDALASYTQSIALKFDFADAHSNLGVTLQELDRLDEAEASYRQAIELNPDFALAYSQLGTLSCMNGDIDSGLENLEKAHNIDATLDNNKIILTILQARKALGIAELSADNISNLGCSSEQFRQPVILKRAVEAELISSLYKMKSIELDMFDNSRLSDPRFGDGKCSRDFKVFEDNSPIIKSVEEDLTIIMREVVNSDICISESFFNIFGAGGGTIPHSHLGEIDTNKNLNFGKQKYSLVYYLSVGDQNCMDPGILKLYDPSEDILPYEGMIVIFPADRKHSAVYSGEKDRVMIGVNFYSL